MAKLALLFTVVFLLFTFSQARFVTTDSDEALTDLPEFDPESTTAIIHPSERPDFESTKLLDFKHDDDETASATETDSSVRSVPLKKISFHPVNRHFPRRPVVFPFGHHHNHRNCRFNKHFRHFNPRFDQKRFISYGNDMVVSDERSFDPESRGVVRQIEARWGNFHDDGAESNHRDDFMKHHHHDHEHHDHEHDEDHEDNHKHHHDHHDHDHEHHHEHHNHHGREEARDESEQHEDGGLMEKFRRLFLHV